MTDAVTARDRRDAERLALSLVEICVRNTQLETLHAGTSPRSKCGDFSDVTVVTPYGDIAWTDLSRISDEEMKALMIEVVDRVFTYVSFPEVMAGLRTSTGRWDRPRLDENLMKTVRRRQGCSETGEPGADPDRADMPRSI